MDRSRIVAVPEWVRPLGHVDGMIARGRTVYLAGQVGWDERCVFSHRDLVGQIRQALSNVLRLLQRVGAGPEHITRMTWFLADKRDYQQKLPVIARAYYELIGAEFPPLTAVAVSSLMHDEALIEMEVTAVIDDEH